MSARGAPLRFLGVVAVCWIGARIYLLWPEHEVLPDAVEALAPAALPKVPLKAVVAMPLPLAERSPVLGAAQVRSRARPLSSGLAYGPTPIASMPMAPRDAQIELPTISTPVDSPPAVMPWITPRANRWSASGWFVARAGRGIATAPGSGQLGGGQAGVRVAYLLARRAQVSAFARLLAPLAGQGREAAVGLEWQPIRAPLRLVAERRFGLDGVPGGNGLGLVAGLDETAAGLRLEGYGQAGAIRRQRTEPYADGAVRITHRIGRRDVRLSLGAGLWGAAQRGAERLDAGPAAVLTTGPVRISLDWRQRVAGRARPGSGLALTLGGDF